MGLRLEPVRARVPVRVMWGAQVRPRWGWLPGWALVCSALGPARGVAPSSALARTGASVLAQGAAQERALVSAPVLGWMSAPH